jgi:unsaturated rhamnogalacturonyl hydrolase
MDSAVSRVTGVADSLLDLDYSTWGFGDSVAFEAMLAASDATGDPRYEAFAHGWIRAWATRALPYRGLDCTAPGAAMVAVARRTGDARVVAAARGLADYLRSRPTLEGVYLTWEHSPLMHPYGPAQLPPPEAALLCDPPPGVFLDCLHFDPPFLTALGNLTGDAELVADGLAQARGYVRLLQREDGLFDHFRLTTSAATYGPGWGRGQGWAVLGLLDVIEAAPAGEDVTELRRAASDLIERLVELQRDDGHWWAVVDDPSSGEEWSTAAFMAYAFQRAWEMSGLLDDGPRILSAARLARQAVVAGLDSSGTLGQVSAAVMACTQPSHYAHVPRGFRVPWGQGPALLALVSGEETP